MDIGRLYSIMIEDCAKPGEEVNEMINTFKSFIRDEISTSKSALTTRTPII